MIKSFFNKHYILVTRVIYFSLLIFLLNIYNPVVVNGSSMYPTLESGDTLFMNKHYTNIEIGDIVVVEPLVCFRGKIIIKRVTNIRDGEIFLEGDNKENSLDSRIVGWIPIEHVLGVIIK